MLIDTPLLLLFLVMGVGAALGSVRSGGIALGPAPARFAGLAVSAYDDGLANTPGIVTQLGPGLPRRPTMPRSRCLPETATFSKSSQR